MFAYTIILNKTKEYNPMAKANSQVFSHPLKPSELMFAMRRADRVNKSLMVWGAPGIGKSMLVQAYADKTYPLVKNSTKLLAQLTAEAESVDMPQVTMRQVEEYKAKLLDQETNLVDFRLSQVDPVDMRGIPVPVTFYADAVTGEMVPDHLVTATSNVIKKTQTVWAPAAVLDLPPDWKGVIFMDEVNGAMPIVQAACYQLFLDRRLGELVLPKGALVMAAGNRECDGGVTFQLATPLKDRMIHVELKADLAEWFPYAMSNLVDADVISFLKARGEDFNTLSPTNPNVCGGTSPRSWVVASDLKKDFREDVGNGTTAENRVLYAMLDGILGDDVAIRFKAHCEMTCKLPAAMDILTGKTTNVRDMPNMDISKHYAICSNIVYELLQQHNAKNSKQVSVEDYSEYANNFLKFIDGNYGDKDQELAMMAVKTMFDQKVFFHPKQVPFYIDFAKKHSALVTQARMA